MTATEVLFLVVYVCNNVYNFVAFCTDVSACLHGAVAQITAAVHMTCVAVRPLRFGVPIRARRLVGTCRSTKCIFRELYLG